MSSTTVRAVAQVFVVALLSSGVSGQTTSTGSINGTVRDVSGAGVPGVVLEVANPSIGLRRQMLSNSEGAYTFTQLPPGDYTITASAPQFQKSVVSLKVNVAQSVLEDISLMMGTTTQTVEVKSAEAQVDLQTTDASVGDVLQHHEIEALPTTQRQITELVYLQPATTPIVGGGEGSVGGGSIAGGRVDQNNLTLDGLIVTDQAEGGYLVSGTIASFGIPEDAIQEFRGTVSNPGEDQARSGGGQFSMTTRRGANTWHGTGYDYYQNAALNANTWTRNRLGEQKPRLISNRFGGSVGGPIWKDKTFVFVDYEGYRFPQSQDSEATGVSQAFKNGILQFPDANGKVNSYNFNPANGALAAACGATGTAVCDPRGIGASPLILNYLNTFYPVANDPSSGDGLNTAGIRAAVSTPIHTDFGLFRIDHNINSNWRAFAELFDEQIHITDPVQLDFNPQVTNGKLLVSTSGTPQYPLFAAGGLTGQLTSSLVYDFRFGYNQQGFTFARQFPSLLSPEAGQSIQLAAGYLNNPGNSTNAILGPEGSLDKSWQTNNTFSWVKSKHVLAFGLMYQHLDEYHYRTTSGSGATSIPIAQITSGEYLSLPDSVHPPTCNGTLVSNCILSADVPRWNSFYSTLLGIWDNTQTYNPRSQSGAVVPGTTPISYDQTAEHFEFTASDKFQFKPSLTFSYGINVTYETPYRDVDGKEYLIINADTGQLIDPKELIKQKAAAALQGQTFNVPMAYVHPAQMGNRSTYPVVLNGGPRAALAWNPSYQNGFLNKAFGDRKTVVRGGYALVHDQILGIQTELYGVLGNLLLGTGNTVQAPSCEAHGTPGVNCVAGSSPYRIGVDGPAFTATPSAFTIPFVPGSRDVTTGTPFGAPSTYGFDPNFGVGSIHSFNATVQRELPGNSLVEVGYIGRLGRNLSTSMNVNAPPVFLKDVTGKSQQTFAQAYDAVANQLRAGVNPSNVTAQPWFENAFGAGGTSSVAGAGSSSLISGETNALIQNVIDPMMQIAGRPTIENQQFGELSFQTNLGWMNYNAGFVSFRKRTSHGLTLIANYTLSHCLDSGLAHSDNLGGALNSPYNPGFFYGACNTDARQVAQVYGRYDLPTPKLQSGLLRRLTNGWSASYIYTAYTGLPLQVYAGDAFGSAQYGPGTGLDTAVATSPVPQTSRHTGVNGSSGVGSSGDAANGGSAANLFADPQAVYDSLRPVEISTDGRSARGLFRGLGAWNLDFSVAKETAIAERARMKLTFDFFNIFNHPNLLTPSLSLYSPNSFGVITADQSAIASQNVGVGPRRIQASLRFEF